MNITKSIKYRDIKVKKMAAQLYPKEEYVGSKIVTK